MKQMIEKLEDLFKEANSLIVPPYQRAYAWEEEQLKQFVTDMLEMTDKPEGAYYYGHFILEKTNGNLEIIDGQQRITTFILFLIVCEYFYKASYGEYINKFETVDYDKVEFEEIKKKINDLSNDWKEDIKIENYKTLSVQRIVNALNYFKKLFMGQDLQMRLETSEIKHYVKTLNTAKISTHIAGDKAVAVQIFELQNTRGLKLSLIEKIKSKLMKAVYLNSKPADVDENIRAIQNHFAEIYRFEELASSNSFRGEIKLEDILLHHLRMVDDGLKLNTANKIDFSNPRRWGDKEEAIMVYLDEKLSTKVHNAEAVVKYVQHLTEKFRESVMYVSELLPQFDKENSLIGDVIILDKTLSIEFFILLYHQKLNNSLENSTVLTFWEKLIFTRDFHEKYHGLRYGDDFDTLFFRVCKKENIEDILSFYLKVGFRPDKMIDGSLVKTVSEYFNKNEGNILNNAYYWPNEKMVYSIFKYEISIGADKEELRKIIKTGRSVEHILPREWDWSWIREKEPISEAGKKFNDEIQTNINGIGNLLLITANENSSQSNRHPNLKHYRSCSGGSYELHNINKEKWNNHLEWVDLIKSRGQKIYAFIQNFIHV